MSTHSLSGALAASVGSSDEWPHASPLSLQLLVHVAPS